MIRRTRLLGLLLAAAAAVGCTDNGTNPNGTPSTAAVRVYVDMDASGTYTAGDQAITGATVSLQENGGSASYQATSGSDGIANFTGVAPGSYTASLSGDVQAPAGSTLSSPAEVTLRFPFSGKDVESEFRFVYYPGTIAGTIYRDDDSSGTYSAGDTPALNFAVQLYAGADTTGDPLASTTTDAEGAYRFTLLEPGQYTILVSPPFPTVSVVGGTTQQVTVAAQDTTVVPVQFTGNLLSSLADVRAGGDGEIVAVKGVVTWHQPFSDRTYFIQDATGGVEVYDYGAHDVQAGDTVLVVGTTSTYKGEMEITDISLVLPQGSGPVPSPVSVSAADVNAGKYQGELAKIVGATVLSVDTLKYDNQYVLLRSASGDTVAVYADSRTGVKPDAWTVGTPYSVTGIVRTDNGASFEFPHRIEVRSPDDVQGLTLSTIAAARAMEDSTVLIRGVVSVNVGAFGGSNYYVQDATGGIAVYQGGAPKLKVGDLVQIVGPVSVYRGEAEINGAQSVSVISSGNAITPVVLTAADANKAVHQGEVATVKALTVDSVKLSGKYGNHDVYATDASGATLDIYVDSRTGISSGDWTVGKTYNVTGILSRFYEIIELKPRSPADMELVP